MISLGINIGHDRGAAIVKDGHLIGAIAQERIDRIKHSPSTRLPYEAIDHLLAYLKISFKEIDLIGISSIAVDSSELIDFYRREILAHYGHSDVSIISVPHHLSHAYSTYFTSGFDEAIILVADGGGEIIGRMEESESVFVGRDATITCVEQRIQSQFVHTLSRPQNYIFPFMNPSFINDAISLGKKYEQITRLIGFGYGEEGKTMGLAAYGMDEVNKETASLKSIDFKLSFGDIISEIHEDYLRSDRSFSSYIKHKKANIAQSVQKYTERQVVEIIRYLLGKYGIRNVCLAGGLFLNCPINHKLLETFENIKVHICPCAGDDGQAIGNAFAAFKLGGHIPYNSSAPIPYLGISYTDSDIEEALNSKKLNYKYLDDDTLAQYIAHSIYANKIVGFFYGRSEIGPRALCHRSILANPCWEGMKDYLNQRVKHRESFRPFAPVVKKDAQFEFFALLQDSPYMLFAAQVCEKYKKCIPSVVHVDGTARVQAVSTEDNPLVYKVLNSFESLSGVPIVLNTSFNDNGEPIVESPNDAIGTFLRTNIDILVLNNFVIEKNPDIYTPKGI